MLGLRSKTTGVIYDEKAYLFIWTQLTALTVTSDNCTHNQAWHVSSIVINVPCTSIYVPETWYHT